MTRMSMIVRLLPTIIYHFSSFQYHDIIKLEHVGLGDLQRIRTRLNHFDRRCFKMLQE